MHNIGSVDSIGNIIFLAAEERYATKNATFLIHKVSSTLEENNITADKIKEKLSTTQAEEKKIIDTFLERSKITEEELYRLFESGELKDAEFAFETSLIHDVREITIPRGATIFTIKAS